MLTSIYPTDIESFTILKDASETAQYGSRGASGVIEVTTKKGMSGRTQVAYNGSFGISTVYKNLKMLSGDEYRRVASERGISILDKGYNTDFQKEIEQTGLQQNHHIAFYGGSSESSYRVSLGFMDRQGVILNEDMKNFTSNMNMNQKMFDGFLNCELGAGRAAYCRRRDCRCRHRLRRRPVLRLEGRGRAVPERVVPHQLLSFCDRGVRVGGARVRLGVAARGCAHRGVPRLPCRLARSRGTWTHLRGSGFQQARVAPSRRGERLPAAGDAVHGLWDELAHQRQRDG